MLRKFASPAWAMLEYGWHPLLLLVTTPWFLHRLGTELYGHWMFLIAVVGVGGVLNAGTGAATVKAVSAAVGREAANDTERTVRASLTIAMIGGCALALAALAACWLMADTVLSRMGDPATIRLTGMAAAVLILLEQLDNVFSSAIKGAERFGRIATIEVMSKSLQVIAAALVLLCWPNLSALYIALVAVAILRLMVKSIAAKHLLDLSDLRPSWAGAPELLNFAKWGWLLGLGTMLFGVADRLVVGSLLGAASLAYYSIASQLAMQVHAVAAAGLSVIFPKVSRKLEAGGQFSIWRVTKLTTAGNLLISSSIAVLLIAFGPGILKVWIGTDSARPTAEILPWLVLAYWVLAWNVVPYYILLGMGRIRLVGLTVLASGTVAVGAMYIATTSLGVLGAAAGRGVYAVLSLALILPLGRHLMLERGARLQVLPGDATPDRALPL